MPTERCNGLEIYFERSGEGPRLLFLNGSGATLATTGFVVKLFADRFDVVAHDQRGLGKTEIPQGPYAMADYAADALALMDHLGWDTCRVVGISFGGMVAQELAVTAPERVERLALVCTSAGGDAGASYPLHELEDMSPEERDAIRATISDTRSTTELMAMPEITDPEVLRGMHEQLQARRHHDVADRLHLIDCPTLVAGGLYDGIAPPSNSEAIAARIKGSDLRMYEGGHLFIAQDPNAFPEILDFLAG